MNTKLWMTLAGATIVGALGTGCGNSCDDFDCAKCADPATQIACQTLVEVDDGDSCDAAHDSVAYDSCE